MDVGNLSNHVNVVSCVLVLILYYHIYFNVCLNIVMGMDVVFFIT